MVPKIERRLEKVRWRNGGSGMGAEGNRSEARLVPGFRRTRPAGSKSKRMSNPRPGSRGRIWRDEASAGGGDNG